MTYWTCMYRSGSYTCQLASYFSWSSASEMAMEIRGGWGSIMWLPQDLGTIKCFFKESAQVLHNFSLKSTKYIQINQRQSKKKKTTLSLRRPKHYPMKKKKERKKQFMFYGCLPTGCWHHASKVVLFVNTNKNLADRSDNIIEDLLVALFSDHPGDGNKMWDNSNCLNEISTISCVRYRWRSVYLCENTRANCQEVLTLRY